MKIASLVEHYVRGYVVREIDRNRKSVSLERELGEISKVVKAYFNYGGVVKYFITIAIAS